MNAQVRQAYAPDIIDLLADTAAESSEELDRRSHLLRLCLTAMPEQGRQILHQHYYIGLKIAQIAEQLRKSVAAVEMALVRARRALRLCVEQKLAAGGVACE